MTEPHHYICGQNPTMVGICYHDYHHFHDHHHPRVGSGGWRRVRVIRGNKAKCLPSTNVYHHSLTEYTIVKRKLRISLETLSTKYDRWYFFVCEIIALIAPNLVVSKDLGLWLLKSLSFVIILIWYKKIDSNIFWFEDENIDMEV